MVNVYTPSDGKTVHRSLLRYSFLDMMRVVGSSPIAPTNFSNPTEYEHGTHSQSGFCELGLFEAENIYIPRNEA